MKEDDKWLDEFRSQMNGYSEPLPDGLWEEIEEDLTDSPKVVSMRRHWQAVAAIVLLVIVSSLTLWFWDSQSLPNAEQLLVESSEVTPMQVVEAVTNTSEAMEEHVPAEKTVPMSSHLRKEVKALLTDSVFENRSCQGIDETEPVNEAETEETLQEEPSSESEAEYGKQHFIRQNQSNNLYAQATPRKENSLWSVGVMASVGGAYTNVTYFSVEGSMNGNGPNHIHTSPPPATEADSVSNEAKSRALIPSRSMSDDTKLDFEHHAPLTFGLSVRLRLDGDWSLDTGIMYTLLSSDITSYNGKQKLHYIGIPLKFNRRLWNAKRWVLYAGIGGAVEKRVSGKRTYEHFLNGYVSEVEQKLPSKTWQFSMAASLGAQLNMTNLLGLYIEPGMSYYFNDGSKIQTIRDKRPFVFNLQMGLRFTLPK